MGGCWTRPCSWVFISPLTETPGRENSVSQRWGRRYQSWGARLAGALTHLQRSLRVPRQQVHAAHVEAHPGRRLWNAREEAQGAAPISARHSLRAPVPVAHQVPEREHGGADTSLAARRKSALPGRSAAVGSR